MGRISRKTREIVHAKFGGICAYCGRPLHVDDRRWYQVDHVVPIFHGGTDDLDNLYPSCQPCNWWKNTMSLEQFRRYLVFREKGAPILSRKDIEWLREHAFDLDHWYGSIERHEFAFERYQREQKAIP